MVPQHVYEESDDGCEIWVVKLQSSDWDLLKSFAEGRRLKPGRLREIAKRLSELQREQDTLIGELMTVGRIRTLPEAENTA